MIMSLLFAFESSRVRQRAAPLLVEREQFLMFMLDQGTSNRRLRSVASMLLHVIRLMSLETLRVVDIREIEEAALHWVANVEYKNRNGQRKSIALYKYVALKWLRFHGMVSECSSRIEPDDTYVDCFVHFLRAVRGMSPETIRTSRRRITAFLKWNSGLNRSLAAVTLNEIDEYLTYKLNTGYLPRSIASVCAALRLFFRFAETQGWNIAPIAGAIHRPRIPRYDVEPKGPQWHDVRRLLDHDFGSKPPEIRAAAIVSLCAIYALRSSEIVRLKLSDFDWMNEILTIKRAKSGRVQQFPIQFEVGEKIIRYLKHARPRCACRNLFVSLKPPYRPVDPTALWVVVASRMKRLEIKSRNFGAHSLRHACATQLLHEGSSLPDIAEFLGHRDLKSVSVYAKHDIHALKEVATFSLAGLL